MSPSKETTVHWKDGTSTNHATQRDALITIWDRGREKVKSLVNEDGEFTLEKNQPFVKP